MTKQEMIDELSAELLISKKQCNETINTLIEEIVSAVDTDDKFIQPGFGTFRAVISDVHIGKNPYDNHFYLYPKKRKMRFRLSPVFKEEINE
ncbi:MAG: HU family DNA-binding protein [Treponema sp.]|nr:HU family DNA-binding protein [Treponema sp.]